MIRKFLAVLAAFAVAFNVSYVVFSNIDELCIAVKAKPGPTVRVPNVDPAVIEKVKKVTVLISNEGFGGVGRGTGVHMDRLHVITCAHLLESWEDDLYLYFYDGTVVKGKPMAVSKKADLAIILLDRPVKPAYKVKFQDKVRDGEPIAIVGQALGSMKWYVSGGVISGRHREWLLTDAFQIGGNSGGPWVNAKGEVIGLAAWGLLSRKGERTGINGAIGAKLIKRYIWETKNPPKDLLDLLGRL